MMTNPEDMMTNPEDMTMDIRFGTLITKGETKGVPVEEVNEIITYRKSSKRVPRELIESITWDKK